MVIRLISGDGFVRPRHLPSATLRRPIPWIHTHVNYFKKCDYTDKQIIYIIPTDDDFNFDTEKKVFYIHFLTKDVETVSLDEIRQEIIGFRVMKIYMRSEIFMDVILNMLPWEDFLIGFQCRIYRTPQS